jgi:hypothetical protein
MRFFCGSSSISGQRREGDSPSFIADRMNVGDSPSFIADRMNVGDSPSFVAGRLVVGESPTLLLLSILLCPTEYRYVRQQRDTIRKHAFASLLSLPKSP